MSIEGFFNWKFLDVGQNDNYSTHIAKVPTGWLVKETIYHDKNSELRISSSIIHISDPKHESELAWEALVEDEGFYEYSLVEKYVKAETEERKKFKK